MVQRTVNAKAKIGLRSSIMVWDLNICCSRGHRLFYNTSLKMQIQGSKDSFCLEELNPRIQSQPHYMTIRQSCLKKITRKIRKRGFVVKSENTLKSGKSRLWPPTSTSLMSRRKKRRNMTLVRLRISITIRKATLPVTASSQKTSVGFDNFRANN